MARTADMYVGSEWAVSSTSIKRAVGARLSEPGFLRRYQIDEESLRAEAGGLELLRLGPAEALKTRIVQDRGERRNLSQQPYVRAAVLGVHEPFRKRMTGVRIEVTARGIPVELWVHRSTLEYRWQEWIDWGVAFRAELHARRGEITEVMTRHRLGPPAAGRKARQPRVAELGTTQRDQGWVTKTDVMTYARCPYTYSLLWRGEISRDEIFDEFLRELIVQGVAFHEQVDRSVPPIEIGSKEQLAAVLAAGVTLFHTPTYANPPLATSRGKTVPRSDTSPPATGRSGP